MPRNSSGSYSLPSGNPVVSGTTITAATQNSTMSDVATEMTDSLSRSGKGAMSAPLQVPNGTSAAPALTFSSETNSGRYLAGAGDIRDAVGGTDVMKYQAAGVTAEVAFTTSAAFNANGTNTLGTSTTLTRPTPTTLTGSTGWNFSSGGGYASYWKDATGMVHLEAVGLVGATPSGNPFSAALPVGYRPAGDVPGLAIETSSGATFRAVKIITDGTLEVSATNGEVLWISASWYGAQ